MAELTDSLTVWAEWTLGILRDPTWMTVNNIQSVLYGDVDKVGSTPLICIEPSNKVRNFNGLPRKTRVEFEAIILVYLGSLQDTETTRQQADATAEAIETRLHAYPTCGGLVISSLVSNLESGIANKGGALIRAARLTWTAQSQVLLPLA